MNKERKRAEALIPSPSSLPPVELLALSSIFKTPYGPFDRLWTFHPKAIWKMMSVNMAATGPSTEAGSTNMSEAPPNPSAPSTTLTPPKALPKAGAPSMAMPRGDVGLTAPLY